MIFLFVFLDIILSRENSVTLDQMILRSAEAGSHFKMKMIGTALMKYFQTESYYLYCIKTWVFRISQESMTVGWFVCMHGLLYQFSSFINGMICSYEVTFLATFVLWYLRQSSGGNTPFCQSSLRWQDNYSRRRRCIICTTEINMLAILIVTTLWNSSWLLHFFMI